MSTNRLYILSQWAGGERILTYGWMMICFYRYSVPCNGGQMTSELFLATFNWKLISQLLSTDLKNKPRQNA